MSTEEDDLAMTPEMCLVHCKTVVSKRYAFIKNKNYCYCEDHIPESMMAEPEAMCDKKCSGK